MESTSSGGRTWAVAGRNRSYLLAAVLLLLTVVLGLALLFDWWPTLRGGFDGQWPYARPNPGNLLRLLPAGLALALYGLGAAALFRRPAWLFVAWCFLGSLAVSLALLCEAGDPRFILLSRTISGQASSAFAVAGAITDLHAAYAGWLAAMPGMFAPYPHMSTSTPVWPTLYYGLARLLAGWPGLSARLAQPLMQLQCHNFAFLRLGAPQIASAWLGLLAPAWAALTVLPVYALARRMGPPGGARLAAACWPLVPAPSLFVGSLSPFYLPCAAAAVLLFWAGLGQTRPWRVCAWSGLSGAALGGLILWNMSMAPLLALCGVLALLAWWTARRAVAWLLWLAAGVALGMLLMAAAYTWLIGHTPLALLRAMLQVHTIMHMAYFPWLALHTWDFVLYAGVPLMIVALAAMRHWRERADGPLAVALGLTLGLLILSGIGRGETGRVWMFLMPFAVVVAGLSLARLRIPARRLCLGCQVAWLLILGLVLRPILTPEITPPPAYQDVAPAPLAGPLAPLGAGFGDALRLRGYQAAYRPASGTLALALHWQPTARVTTPYYFSIVPVTPAGQALPGQVWQPFATRYPTTCWRPGSNGQEVVDQVDLSLPAAAPAGNWWLSLTAFAYDGARDPQPLDVHLPDGAVDHQVGLGPVQVP